MPYTPTLGLSLSDDERINRNWELLDAAVRRLGQGGGVIAADLDGLGTLHVTRDSYLDGVVTAPAGLEAGQVSATQVTTGSLTVRQRITAEGGFTVSAGAVAFPRGSVDGISLMPGASVQAVWVSPAEATARVLGISPTVLASVTPDSTEEPGRFEVVFGQGTYQVQQRVGGPTVIATFSLRRGDTEVQSRAFRYSAGAVDIEIPFTMVRLTRITAAPAAWSLWGDVTPAPAAVTVTVRFAQLHVIQFR